MNGSWEQLVLTHCWQLTVLAIVVTLLHRILCRNRPHLACGLWLVVLIKATTPPVWASPTGLTKVYPVLIDEVETDSWQVYGGRGAMDAFVPNLSLVVTQTQVVHERLAEHLVRLRQSQPTGGPCVLEFQSLEVNEAATLVDRKAKWNSISGSPIRYCVLEVDAWHSVRNSVSTNTSNRCLTNRTCVCVVNSPNQPVQSS